MVSILFAILPACLLDKEEVACTTLAAASVSLTVVDDAGVPIPDATVTYAVDGVDKGACEAWPSGGWVCGFEQTGHFVVTVASEGFVTGTAEADLVMDADGCHVVGQAIEVALEPDAVECTEIAVASVVASLTGASGEALEGRSVSWRRADVDDAPWEACREAGADFACGWEEAGVFDVMGTAGGHDIAYALATVPMTDDGCHVVTQQVDLVVDWLPD